MAGSELGPGLVVSLSLALANSRDQSSAAAHPGPLSLSRLSSLFLQSLDQSRRNPAVETITTEASLCKSCELKKVGIHVTTSHIKD